MPGSYLGEPSTPNHPRAPTESPMSITTRTFMPLDAPLLARGGPSNAHAHAAPHAVPPHVSDCAINTAPYSHGRPPRSL
eukprot:scaffold4501_cov72-Phaeocystis_antarctica.AAC.2